MIYEGGGVNCYNRVGKLELELDHLLFYKSIGEEIKID
jgi:hypothetical protein